MASDIGDPNGPTVEYLTLDPQQALNALRKVIEEVGLLKAQLDGLATGDEWKGLIKNALNAQREMRVIFNAQKASLTDLGREMAKIGLSEARGGVSNLNFTQKLHQNYIKQNAAATERQITQIVTAQREMAAAQAEANLSTLKLTGFKVKMWGASKRLEEKQAVEQEKAFLASQRAQEEAQTAMLKQVGNQASLMMRSKRSFEQQTAQQKLEAERLSVQSARNQFHVAGIQDRYEREVVAGARQSNREAMLSYSLRQKFFSSPDGRAQLSESISNLVGPETPQGLKAHRNATDILLKQELAFNGITEKAREYQDELNKIDEKLASIGKTTEQINKPSRADTLEAQARMYGLDTARGLIQMKKAYEERLKSAQEAYGVESEEALKYIELLKRTEMELEKVGSMEQERRRYERVVGPGAGFAIGIQARYLANFAVMGAVIGTITKTSEAVIKLDENLHSIQAISGASAASMEGLRQVIISTASSSKFMADEVADAGMKLAQAGQSVDEIKNTLPAVVTFAQATGQSLSESSDIITTALDAFKLRSSESMDVANQFTAVINHTKLNVKELSEGFQYAGNTAAQLGIDYHDLTIVLGMMANAGLKTGRILGSGLRSVLLELEKPNKTFLDEMKLLGLTMGDIDIRTKGIIPVFEKLHDAGFGAAAAFHSLNARAATAYLAISTHLDQYQGLLKSTLGSNAAMDAAKTQMGSLANAGKNLQSVFSSVVANAFQPFVAALRGVIVGITDVLKLIAPFSKYLAALAAPLALVGIRELIKYLIGLGRSVGVAVSAMKTFGVAATEATAETGLLAGAFEVLTGPVGLAVAAIAGLVAVTGSFSSKSEELASKLEEQKAKSSGLSDSFKELSDSITDLMQKQGVYTDGSKELEFQALKLGEKFRSLGLDVSGVTKSYDGLLGRMRELRSLVLSEQKVTLNQQLDTAKKKLATDQANAQHFVTPKGASEFIFGQTVGLGDHLYGSDKSKAGGFALADIVPASAGDLRSALANLEKVGATPEALDRVITAATRAQARDPKNSALYQRIIDSSNQLGSKVAPVLQDKQEVSSTQSALDQARVLGSPQYAAAEKQLSNVYSVLEKRPTFNPNNPVGSRNEMAAFKKKYLPDNLIKNFQLMVSKTPGLADALTSSGLMDKFNNAVIGYNQDLADASKNAQPAASAADKVLVNLFQEKIKQIEDKMKHASTLGELDALKKELDAAVVGSIRAKVRSFAEGTMKLRPDQYNITAHGLQLTGHANAHDISMAKAYNDQILGGSVIQPNDFYGSQQKRILDVHSATLGKQISTLTSQSQAAFQGDDKNTSLSIIKQHADDAKKKLSEALAKELDRLAEKAKVNHLSPAEEKAQADELRKKYAGMADKIDARYGKFADDPKQALGTFGQAFHLIAQGAQGDSTTGVNIMATTFKDVMLAAIDKVKGGFSNLFTSLLTGTKNAGQAFRELATSILQSMMNVLSNRLASQFTNLLFGSASNSQTPGGFGGLFGSAINWASGLFGSAGAIAPLASIAPDVAGNIAALSVSVPTLYSGGPVRYAFGGGVPTRDSVHALLAPGEYVMRQSAVEAIGVDTLNRLNNLGHANVASASGRLQSAVGMKNNAAPPTTNVYVVAPQKTPQLGPRDVLAVVTDDILKNGTTKKLIKSVAMGH